MKRTGAWVVGLAVMAMLVGGAWAAETTEAAKTAAPAVTLRVPKGCVAAPATVAERRSKDPTGWAEQIVHEKTGIVLEFIPAGKFKMGSPAGEEGRRDSEQQHDVQIAKPFYMAKHEVTRKQWQAVMGDNPSMFKGADMLPVEQVSWNDCQDFLKKAGDGLRLPTDAEWEYACRAGTTTKFSFGDSDKDFGEHGWYDGNSGKKTHEVGSKKPNAWGLHDMHGNVSELCSSLYKPYPYRADDGREDLAATGLRVVRGGSWDVDPRRCRSALCGRITPTARHFSFGLRVVVAQEEQVLNP